MAGVLRMQEMFKGELIPEKIIDFSIWSKNPSKIIKQKKLGQKLYYFAT